MLEKHCRACGAALIEKELKGEGVVPFCPVCGEFRFPMYNVAVRSRHIFWWQAMSTERNLSKAPWRVR